MGYGLDDRSDSIILRLLRRERQGTSSQRPHTLVLQIGRQLLAPCRCGRVELGCGALHCDLSSLACAHVFRLAWPSKGELLSQESEVALRTTFPP
jgi:hypothetical protein